MRAVWVIGLRELKSLIKSPKLYLIGVGCTGLWSMRFLRELSQFALESGRAPGPYGGAEAGNIHHALFINHLGLVHLLCLFIVPAFTMGLISDDKRSRAYDLLLTAPLCARHIALGKFLGGYVGVLFLLMLAFLYPAGTALVADFNWMPLLIMFLGMAFILGAYVSLGLFVSSLTQSPMLSFIITTVLILSLWVLDSSMVALGESPIRHVLEHVSLQDHFEPFIYGGLKLSAVLFFVSFIATFLFLTDRVIESSRWRA